MFTVSLRTLLLFILLQESHLFVYVLVQDGELEFPFTEVDKGTLKCVVLKQDHHQVQAAGHAT